MFRLIIFISVVITAYGYEHHNVHKTKLNVIYNRDINAHRPPKYDRRDERIIGGYLADITEFPYQCVIFPSDRFNEYVCGGSIISSRWILTAAHCLSGMHRVEVRLGSTYIDSGGIILDSTKFTIHNSYNSEPHDYDIGVIDMGVDNIPLNGDTISVVELPKEEATLPIGTLLTITGWGTTEEGGMVSSVLQAVNVNLSDLDECKLAYNITPRMFCAAIPGGGKDSCQGDSGGPLIGTSDRVQYGIVSFGYGCARDNYPGVYTNVAYLRYWIKQNTGV